MKSLLIILLSLGSFTAFASGYECEARLISQETDSGNVALSDFTSGLKVASIDSFRFDVLEQEEHLVFFISNSENRDQSVTNTTYKPKVDQSTKTALRLPNGGMALLFCNGL